MRPRSPSARLIQIIAAAAVALVLFVGGSAIAAASRAAHRSAKRNATFGSGANVVVVVPAPAGSTTPWRKPIYPPGVPLVGGVPVPARLPGVGIYLPQLLPPPPGAITWPASLEGNRLGSAHWHFTPMVAPGSQL